MSNDTMTWDYIEQMRSHVDEGGNLSHRNAVDLLTQVENSHRHIHVAIGNTDGSDTCQRCGLDLRNSIHLHLHESKGFNK